MDRGKIKNFVIITLSLVNCFLLLLVMLDRAEISRIEGDVKVEIEAVLNAAGIVAAPGVAFDLGEPTVYLQRRDLDAELEIARKALGSVEVSDVGGNIQEYSGERGRAVFYGTGDFTIELDAGPAMNPVEPEEVREYLGSLGIASYYDVRRQLEKVPGEIIMTALSGSLPVYNSRIRLLVVDGCLERVEGARVLDELHASAETDMLTAVTAVIRFLDIVRESGNICGEIREIELGAKIEVSSSGGGALVAVWRFITDAGDYFINGISGREELALA